MDSSPFIAVLVSLTGACITPTYHVHHVRVLGINVVILQVLQLHHLRGFNRGCLAFVALRRLCVALRWSGCAGAAAFGSTRGLVFLGLLFGPAAFTHLARHGGAVRRSVTTSSFEWKQIWCQNLELL